MIEFVALIALAAMLVGLGTLVGAYLLAALGWLVVREARRSGVVGARTRDGRHPFPDG